MLKKIIDLILYSNFWIALCATAMVLEGQFIFNETWTLSNLAIYVFFATLFLYAIHRIVGLYKVKDFIHSGRYAIISNFRSHIRIYAIVAGLITLVLFFKLSWRVQLMLIIPALISLGYAIPILDGRRLRDFQFIKIFLIAGVWAWVTVVLPALDAQSLFSWKTFFMIPERVAFIFAITLPFDIRDLEVDQKNGVMTIPSILGVDKTVQLSIRLLAVSLIFATAGWTIQEYPTAAYLGICASILITIPIIIRAPKAKHDYYFTGLLDGTLFLQPLLIWAFWYGNAI